MTNPKDAGKSFKGKKHIPRWYNIAICACFSVIFSACSAHFVSFIDESTNAHIVRMNGNKLAGGISSLSLNVQRFEKDGQTTYSLFIIYSGPFLLNIEPGKTLTVIIDGKPNVINGSGSERHRNRVSPLTVEEIAYYHDIEPGLIRQMAYAKEVKIEVKGSSETMNRYFREKNFARFREFYSQYVEK